MFTTAVLLDEHDRLPTPPFTVTTKQYTHRSVRASDEHDVLMRAVDALVRVGVKSTADTSGGTVSTTQRTVRGDLSADSVVTAHTVRAWGPSASSVSSSDDDDSDTTVHECVSCAAGVKAPLAFTLRTVTLCGPVASGPTRSLLPHPANEPPSSEYSNHALRAVEFSSKSPYRLFDDSDGADTMLTRPRPRSYVNQESLDHACSDVTVSQPHGTAGRTSTS
jgi:hypothetical protein